MKKLTEGNWQAGVSLQDRGHGWEALQHYRMLCSVGRWQQAHAAHSLRLAGRLFQLNDRATALAYLRRLKKSRPSPDLAFLIQAALLLRQEGEYSVGLEFAEAVLEKSPPSQLGTDAMLLAGECCHRLRRLPECLDWVDRAQDLSPNSIPALRLRAAVLRESGEGERAVRCLEAMLHRIVPNHWETCRAWFELGHAFESIEEPRKAWQAWSQARTYYSTTAHWNLYRTQASHMWLHLRQLHQSLTSSLLRKWADHPAPVNHGESRIVILSGHPRSGTTLLEQSLDAHSAIRTVEESAIFTAGVYRPLFEHGFAVGNPAQHLDQLSIRELEHWQQEYVRLLSLSGSDAPAPALLVDKNPDLLQLLPAVLRIIPGIQFLVMLRDPRDLIVSMFSQALPPNHTAWSYRSLTHTAEMITVRLGLWHHLKNLLPDTVYQEVKYEDLVSRHPQQIDRLLGYLGLPLEESTLKPAAHAASKTIKSPSFSQVLQPLQNRSIGRWRKFAPELTPVLSSLERALTAFGYGME